jgi:hydrogenase/urease accessory protein HupE
MSMRRPSVVLLLALSALSAQAHEIGTTQVSATFLRDHTYRVELVTAPQSLLSKLEVAAKLPRSPKLPPAETRQHLLRLAPILLQHVRIDFGTDTPPPHVTIETNEYAARAVFTGEISRNARTFAWRYDLAYSAYALSLQNDGDAAAARQWLEADQTSAPFPLAKHVLPPSRLDVVRQYLTLGFTHIVPYGLDHILFVLGLFLLTTRAKPLMAQITAFTIAHSITLGLTMYGLVSLSARIVEPAIALSIVFVAVENLTTTTLRPWRIALVFCFGLLHGMGFAGVLRELGLPRSQFLTALVSFNVGVEAGQLTVVAAAFLLIAHWHRRKAWFRPRFVVPASALIALTGLAWTVQRIL